jgi:hypothetical protein
VSALANQEVGVYLNRHFVAAFQKVATFQVNGGQKQGGNVASYFCTADGLVLHAIAGPVNSMMFLREARWANETYELALLENRKAPEQLRAFFRKAHLDRLKQGRHMRPGPALNVDRLPTTAATPAALGKLLDHNGHLGLDNPGKIHLLLAVAPLPQVQQVYQVVFEKILNEKISTNPVALAGR